MKLVYCILWLAVVAGLGWAMQKVQQLLDEKKIPVWTVLAFWILFTVIWVVSCSMILFKLES